MSNTPCQSKIDLLRTELKAFKSHHHTNQWYRNIILLMAEIIISSHEKIADENNHKG